MKTCPVCKNRTFTKVFDRYLCENIKCSSLFLVKKDILYIFDTNTTKFVKYYNSKKINKNVKDKLPF